MFVKIPNLSLWNIGTPPPRVFLFKWNFLFKHKKEASKIMIYVSFPTGFSVFGGKHRKNTSRTPENADGSSGSTWCFFGSPHSAVTTEGKKPPAGKGKFPICFFVWQGEKIEKLCGWMKAKREPIVSMKWEKVIRRGVWLFHGRIHYNLIQFVSICSWKKR